MASKAAVMAHQKRVATTDQLTDSYHKQYSAFIQRKVKDTQCNFKLFSQDRLDAIPTFAEDELELGRVVERGTCEVVREIREIRLRDDGGAPNEVEQVLKDKEFLSSHCLREGGDARYVVKSLSAATRDPELFARGVVDLAVETTFLSSLSHPHIIKLRALGAEGMLSPNYFIVTDRLTDRLDSRIRKWGAQAKKANSVTSKLLRNSSGKLDELKEAKIKYAYDLMGAIEYLHKHRVIFRNLKPEHVGFNVRDDVVLFDFGLAREIGEESKVTEHTWKLTGETGSLLYMAPEVAESKPYGYSADIYSFGILLWSMLAAEKPFAKVEHKAVHMELVVSKGARPKIEELWGPSLGGFLKECWHQDLTRRPSAARASSILKREVAKAAGGDDNALVLNNFKRKSTFVNREALREKFSSSLRSRNSDLDEQLTSVDEVMESAQEE